MQWYKGIPSLLTSFNLLCGVFAILFSFREQFDWAVYAIIIAGVMDFFDGFVARLLKATSAFGRELDSLADVVTFGVAPAFLMFCFDTTLHDPVYVNDIPQTYYGAYAAFLMPVFAALRLARFNIDRKQKSGFLGVPTPANAFFFIGLPMIWMTYPDSIAAEWVSRIYAIPAFCVLFSLLMVLPLPLLALKFPKGYGFKDNFFRYLLVVVSLVFFLMWQWSSLPLIILSYIIISLLSQLSSSFVKS